MKLRNILLLGCVTALLGTVDSSAVAAAGPATAWTSDPACQTDRLAAAGGALPKNKDMVVLRYVGSSNIEFSYRNKVILFDADYGRMPPARPLPVTRDQLTKVDAIYVGHGHADHLKDGPFIAELNKAPLYGAWPTTEAAKKMGLPDDLNKTVKTGDVQRYDGFTIETVLAGHSPAVDPTGLRPKLMTAWLQFLKATDKMPAPAAPGIISGSVSPDVMTEGTIGFLITFDSGYKLYIQDSFSPIRDEQRALIKRIGGKVDLATVGYQGYILPDEQIKRTLPLIELLKPDVFFPNHHDQTGGIFPDIATYPLFSAIRAKLPSTRSVSLTYGTPICVNTKMRGPLAAFVGESWTWPSTR